MEKRGAVFITHSVDDAVIAAAIKRYLEGLFVDLDVFVSSRDLKGGELWMKTLHARLQAARAIVAIVTSSFIEKPLGTLRGRRWVCRREDNPVMRVWR
jgi:hypothetical protein